MNDPLELAGREERAGIVATLARRLGDLERAEDAVQEAFAVAAARWPRDGIPDRPGAWLTTTAWRKALDGIRRARRGPRRRRGGRAARAATTPGRRLGPGPRGRPAAPDPHLLPPGARSRGPHRPDPAPRRRAHRHRDRRRVPRPGGDADQAARPGPHQDPRRPHRLHGARPGGAARAARRRARRIYLVFTEGHLASGDGSPIRAELCDEAIWLARQVHALVPHDGESTGLLALLLLQHARTPARQDEAGRLVPFALQDQARWDAAAIEEARRLLATTGGRPPGPYQVQAAIAALHATAPSAEQVDWARIAGLYGVLARLDPSPVVEVNRAVAVGRADGPVAGLAVLEPVLDGGRLERYAPLYAAHADLLERRGDRRAARAAWLHAAGLADNPAQQAELERRAAGL